MATKRTRMTKAQGVATKKRGSKSAKGKSSHATASPRPEAGSKKAMLQKDGRSDAPKPAPAHAKNGKPRKPDSNGHVKRRVPRRSTDHANRTEPEGLSSDHQTPDHLARIDQLGARIAAYLFRSLEGHATTHQLGWVTGPKHFEWGETESQELSPDMAFVSFERWAPYREVPSTLTWHVVPDLVVEILGGSEDKRLIQSRLNDYFKAGVRRAWMVQPGDFRILDYESPSEYRTLKFDECIDGGSLLPGFELPLAELKGDQK